MVLTVNVTNTNITIGVFNDENKLVMVAKTVTDKSKSEEEYAQIFSDLCANKGVRASDIEGSILSCVVAQLAATIEEAIIIFTDKKPMKIEAGVKTGLPIKADNPAEIGSDIIVGAVGAISRYKKPIVVVALNTATVFTVINDTGTLVGVSIAPGVRISAEALSVRASQLPYVALEAPARVIGRNTAECMKSGIMHGAAAMIDGMVDRIEAELGSNTTVVITGPLAKRIAPLCKVPAHIDEFLQLEGMNGIYRKNTAK